MEISQKFDTEMIVILLKIQVLKLSGTSMMNDNTL